VVVATGVMGTDASSGDTLTCISPNSATKIGSGQIHLRDPFLQQTFEQRLKYGVCLEENLISCCDGLEIGRFDFPPQIQWF